MDNQLLDLVGDTPVSEQINQALQHHIHEQYATCEEVAMLKSKIELLLSLVGDTPVSEQIQNIINNIP